MLDQFGESMFGNYPIAANLMPKRFRFLAGLELGRCLTDQKGESPSIEKNVGRL
jgi:hypothetical protein